MSVAIPIYLFQNKNTTRLIHFKMTFIHDALYLIIGSYNGGYQLCASAIRDRKDRNNMRY